MAALSFPGLRPWHHLVWPWFLVPEVGVPHRRPLGSIPASAAQRVAPSNTSLLVLISDYCFYNPIIILQRHHAFVVYIRCFRLML